MKRVKKEDKIKTYTQGVKGIPPLRWYSHKDGKRRMIIDEEMERCKI